MHKRQRWYEQRQPRLSGLFQKNLQQFGELVGLSANEVQILGFAVVLQSNQGLNFATDLLGGLSHNEVVNCLSIVLELTFDEVWQVLSRQGLLSRAGILRLPAGTSAYLRLNLKPGMELANTLFAPHKNTLAIVRSFFHPTSAPQLKPHDYKHVKKDFQLIKRYLRQAQKQGLTGVNILVYGSPGTGKSEIARTLADSLDFNLFDISTADSKGDALIGNHRFSAYLLCQQILSRQKKTLILFDEIEDVFPDNSSSFAGGEGHEDRRKAWINKLLEENPVPAIWISNAIKQIDNAFIRRFDLVLKLNHPPRKARAEILSKHLRGLPVSSQWIENAAENPDLAPAVVSRVARVAGTLKTRNRKDMEANLELIMGNTLKAMGYSDKVIRQPGQTISYRLDALNPDQNIQQLVKGLKRRPQGRFCLYGPPGTGKTEFGHFAARTLDKPLLITRASDLLDSYVGKTEKNIARMFQQGGKDDMVVLLDEADSFLQDRTSIRNSWGVTQVNELLTSIEAFEGLFICSTNLIDNLDAASLRRFDYKIHFDYLTTDQAWRLFRQVLKDHRAALHNQKHWRTELATHNNLTPGDFATVVRQRRLSDQPLTPAALMQGLTAESGFKQPMHSHGIGFTAHI
ncbi:MAG: ATP-binding protein [gamma proteobacterium symbiont of Bathyaustriella thionipta]|nr:ATP-binding protein [gamma proteobacterium symbiont of Bathyaustriella thionipta]